MPTLIVDRDAGEAPYVMPRQLHQLSKRLVASLAMKLRFRRFILPQKNKGFRNSGIDLV